MIIRRARASQNLGPKFTLKTRLRNFALRLKGATGYHRDSVELYDTGLAIIQHGVTRNLFGYGRVVAAAGGGTLASEKAQLKILGTPKSEETEKSLAMKKKLLSAIIEGRLRFTEVSAEDAKAVLEKVEGDKGVERLAPPALAAHFPAGPDILASASMVELVADAAGAQSGADPAPDAVQVRGDVFETGKTAAVLHNEAERADQDTRGKGPTDTTVEPARDEGTALTHTGHLKTFTRDDAQPADFLAALADADVVKTFATAAKNAMPAKHIQVVGKLAHSDNSALALAAIHFISQLGKNRSLFDTFVMLAARSEHPAIKQAARELVYNMANEAETARAPLSAVLIDHVSELESAPAKEPADISGLLAIVNLLHDTVLAEGTHLRAQAWAIVGERLTDLKSSLEAKLAPPAAEPVAEAAEPAVSPSAETDPRIGLPPSLLIPETETMLDGLGDRVRELREEQERLTRKQSELQGRAEEHLATVTMLKTREETGIEADFRGRMEELEAQLTSIRDLPLVEQQQARITELEQQSAAPETIGVANDNLASIIEQQRQRIQRELEAVSEQQKQAAADTRELRQSNQASASAIQEALEKLPGQIGEIEAQLRDVDAEITARLQRIKADINRLTGLSVELERFQQRAEITEEK
ncbi:hypothetical protein ACFL5U_01790 [Candidatus Margulisiibacteriota bacterium]